MRIIMASLALSAAALAPYPVAGQAADVAAPNPVLEKKARDIVAALRGETKPDTVFTPAFLAAISPTQLADLVAGLESSFGPLVGLESVEEQAAGVSTISLRFERAIVRGPVTLDPGREKLVAGLLLNDVQPLNVTPEQIRADIAAMPGRVTVLYAPLDGSDEATLSIGADEQMAIGSTFKLYILAALSRQISSGERNWADVVTLNRKSFPSGQMQDWPDGAPVTLHTLATMMISISDNTATDMLLQEVGVAAVENELVRSGHSRPDRALPFLGTLQMFGLKGSEFNLAKFIAADEAGKRRILADFEDDTGGNPRLVTPPTFIQPTAIDTVEWFASGQDLRKLIRAIAGLPDPVARQILAVSPSLPKARRDQWQYVGFKGGSEPGVLNLTWLLQHKAGQWRILTISWNNPNAQLDATTLELLAQRILPLAS